MQCPRSTRLRMSSGKVFGLCVNGVHMTGSGVPLCSSLDHLLLKPFHLKKNTQGTDVEEMEMICQLDGQSITLVHAEIF